jgi:Tol biopolymer transport system component
MNAILFSLMSISLLSFTYTEEKIGDFDGQTDIGTVKLKGDAQFDAKTKQYTITGSGENMWAGEDAFHFLWRKTSGDQKLSTSINWSGTVGHEHRKAGLMIRQNLDANAAYIDAVVHGNGLVSLQYREHTGDETQEIQAPVKSPAGIMLERNGDLFTLSVAGNNGTFNPVCSKMMQLKDPIYTGLAVCSHDPAKKETAVFSNVHLENQGVIPDNAQILESTLETVDIDTGRRQIIYRVNQHIEAPNWFPSGEMLLYNSGGKLYSIPLKGGSPSLIPTGEANQCNNDHGFSPDGKWIALSHNTVERGSLIYIVPSEGGNPRLVTKLGPSYWHGWSPDGKNMAYCAQRDNEFDIYTINIDGSQETRLTDAPGLDDGPEYSPDGKYIYFNSERSGLMKIWRMLANGQQQKQIAFDDVYADWFPHPSPDGKWLVFLSYDKSVKGHPANQEIVLRIMPATGGEPKILTHLFGGQGTINVPSWSPDSKKFAFVSYRLVAKKP